jgi:ATP synthase protein I
MNIHSKFRKEIARKERKRLVSLKHPDPPVWFGLGTFGVVGWSVAIPTIAGIGLGIWIDKNFPSRYSWTLILLTLGIMAGCFTAWAWISRQRREIHDHEQKRQEEESRDERI